LQITKQDLVNTSAVSLLKVNIDCSEGTPPHCCAAAVRDGDAVPRRPADWHGKYVPDLSAETPAQAAAGRRRFAAVLIFHYDSNEITDLSGFLFDWWFPLFFLVKKYLK
jgi:hypothetical protein